MSRRLNAASVLLLVVGIVGFSGLTQIFSPFNPASEWSNEEFLGVTILQVRDFNPGLVDAIELAVQTRGLYLFLVGLLWSVIALIPYRMGEKWAWYALLVTGAIWLPGFLIFNYAGVTLGLYASFFMPLNIIMFVLWIVGLALPAKEILGKPSS